MIFKINTQSPSSLSTVSINGQCWVLLQFDYKKLRNLLLDCYYGHLQGTVFILLIYCPSSELIFRYINTLKM
jgi:hypothetical protein